MNNIERAIEIIEDEHDPHFGPIDAPSLIYALNGDGSLMPDLPAPSRDMVSPAGGVWYSNGPLSDIRSTRDGIVAFGSWKETPFRVQLTATQAEELAAILWAAARYHAEQEQGDE